MNELVPIAFLDEKWFYRVNRRRKIKHLPPPDGKNETKKSIPRSKMLSRRFPIKNIFVGIVGCP